MTFTAYAVRLSFFEAIALDSLIRGGRQAMILARRRGRAREFRRAGGQRVEKDYEVVPIAVTSGRIPSEVSVSRGARLPESPCCQLKQEGGGSPFRRSWKWHPIPPSLP